MNTELEQRDYSVTIVRSSCELSARDKIFFKDLSNSEKLVDLVEVEDFVMNVQAHIEMHVHNEKSKDSKEYDVFVFVDESGRGVYTSSRSVYESVRDIIADMDGEDEDYSIKFTKKPSKNRAGQFFLSATIA